MKLDEKYFIPFIAIIAIMAALIIVFFTISNREGKEQAFRKSIVSQDSLSQQLMPTLNGADSLGISSFPNHYVVLDFWATWTASFSRQAHLQLLELKEQNPERLQVLAAVVQDKPENVKEYINRYDYPFHYVDGTEVFNRFKVPGVPTQLVYTPAGKLHSIFTGRADSTRMDSLKKIISDE
jgi:thiol:disulfide interchange protein